MAWINDGHKVMMSLHDSQIDLVVLMIEVDS